MNITQGLASSRGISNLISRIGTITSRFGFTSTKFADLMERYNSLAKENGFIATLPITAVILERHSELIRRFNHQSIEFAIHGYVHIDYQKLPGKDQFQHYQKAIDTFNRCRVPYTGFRAPYLRFNRGTQFALSSLNFAYNSSHSIYWNVLDKSNFSTSAWFEYLRALEYYQSQNSLDYLSLPRYSANKHLIEIPVSLPDDEAMMERLGIKESAAVTQVWNAMLQEIHRRGELFTLQLHPERVNYCGPAVKAVIHQAKMESPGVWITTLREIAEWWRERESFSFNIHPEIANKFKVQARCSDRATILVRNCRVSAETAGWRDNYQIVTDRDFKLESSTVPVIGIGLNSSPEAVRFLQSEGFAFEVSNQVNRFGVHLGDLKRFQPADERRILDEIEYSDAPLIRFWRWPDRHGSALTVTGDIDSITLFDFFWRLIEARHYHKQSNNPTEVIHAGATS